MKCPYCKGLMHRRTGGAHFDNEFRCGWCGCIRYGKEIDSPLPTVLADSKNRYDKLQDLTNTVQINCDPPDDCNDPAVLKAYMKTCFEKALQIQEQL